MTYTNFEFNDGPDARGFQLEAGRVRLYKGGNNAYTAQPTQTEVSNTSIAPYAKPYVESNLAKVAELTDIDKNPYRMYKEGDPEARVAAFDPMQTAAFDKISGMTVAPQLGEATTMAGTAGTNSMNAGANYANMATDPNSMGAYMSPYMQNVVNLQQQQAARNYGIQLQNQQAQAVGQHAFGGNRQALAQAEGTRNLAFNQAQIQATGSQAAWDSARQAQQFGITAGLQGNQQAITAANTLGQLGQTQFGQQNTINNANLAAGALKQGREQELKNVGYENFQNAQNYPFKLAAFQADMTRGLPLGQTASTMYKATPSAVSQAMGGGIATLGAVNAMTP